MIQISAVNRRHGQNPGPRIPEFIERLNQMHPRAIRYQLIGDELHYVIRSVAHLRGFDRDMMGYIDHAMTVPFRFVSQTAEFVDSFAFATVDIDDLLNATPFSFAMNMLHILEERFRTPNYETRRRSFRRPHMLGILKERDYLRGLLGDPGLRYTGERGRGQSRYVFTFRGSQGNRVEHRFTTIAGRTSSDVFMIDNNGERTLSAFLGRG